MAERISEEQRTSVLMNLAGTRQRVDIWYGQIVDGIKRRLESRFRDILSLGISPTVRFESGEKAALYIGFSQRPGNFHDIVMPDGSLFTHERVAKKVDGENVFYDNGRPLTPAEYVQNEDRAYAKMEALARNPAAVSAQ